MRTTGRRGEPDRSKTGASRHLPVRRESDNPRKGKPDRSEVGGGRPLNRVQKERQLKQDIGEIEATELADGSVTEAKLASGAVTSTKIGVDAITEDSISSASVSESKINDGAVTTNKLDSSNSIVVLSGVPLGDSDLGTFTGTTIADNETIKGALQDLETAVEAGGGVKYHGRYDTEAETARSGATTTTEIYYTARPDGDGYAESEVTTSTPAGAVIERTLYYSDKFDADPDTSGDWTAYTTQPADDTAFATAKAALLAGLSDTDGTANTRGTLPVSLKMEHKFATDLLLEDYPGAAAAYSVRKIRDAYTGDAMRVREDGGNTETDIGFDSNGDLDTAAIATHCGSANGYVVTWYDQSGNGNDATQSTTTRQPEIYDGSSVITHNGHPALEANGNYSLLTGRNYSATFSAYLAVYAPSNAAGVIYSGANNTGFAAIINFSTVYRLQIYSGTNLLYQPAGTAPSHNLLSTVHNGTSSSIHNRGILRASGDAGTDIPTNMSLFGRDLYGPRTTCSLHEIIFYESDHSANRAGVESNINDYYSIY